MKVLELRKGRYTLLDLGHHIKNFVDIKLLRSGELVVFGGKNSDLTKYDRNLKCIKKLPGKKKINIGSFSFF